MYIITLNSMRRLKSKSRFANDALSAAKPIPRLFREHSHVLDLYGLELLETIIYIISRKEACGNKIRQGTFYTRSEGAS